MGKKKVKDRIARYRCGNEVRKGSQHWREEEDRVYRIYRKEEENLEHILRKCQATRSEIQVEEFFSDKGRK